MLMPLLRNRFSVARAGGPRQFSELRNKLLIEANDREELEELRREMRELALGTELIESAPILVAEPSDKIETTIERLRTRGVDGTKVRQAISTIQDARKKGESVIDTTSATMEATRELITTVREMPQVADVRFVTTQADYGPENLRLSPTEMDTIDPGDAVSESGTLQDLIEKLGVPEAWETTRGENAVVVIFDTAYSRGLIDESRIVGTFSGEKVDGVYESSEGHGTMCVGAAAANSDKDGVPFDGVAPESDVVLVRTTDEEGQIRGDIISKAWDWIAKKDFGKPKVINHSYGTPICSGRPKAKFCSGPEVDMVKLANSKPDVTSVYAAGNEAMSCGHRPSGLTNAVTGTNSLAEVITVGALRYDSNAAQRYSSHGRGDCAPVADPKPNVSCAIPFKTYYGGEDGWEIKDMSTGIGGSSGGTSHAAPMTAGLIALMQSASVENRGEPLQTEEVKQILKATSKTPRRNQINSFGAVLGEKGYDARFGHGQWQPAEAVNEVINNG